MSIICGTDLTPASADALAVACGLSADREVVLVHVVEAEDRAVLDEARRKLDAQAAQAKGAHVRAELVVGSPDTTLISFAETEGSELILIAASSHGQARLGSTATSITLSTRVPVLVLRDPAPWLAFVRGERPMRLLLGLDESIASELCMQWTHALRARGTADVVLGAIYYPDDAAEYYGLHARALVDRDPQIEQLMARDLERRFGSTARVTAVARRGLGRVGDHLIEVAREQAVDAIVIGTGQNTGLIDRLGSVSSVVVHDATQSVVCVPPGAMIPTLTTPAMSNALVATDLSPFANRAVPFAFSIVQGEIHVAHVIADDADADEAELTRAMTALAPAGMKQLLVPHVVRGDNPAVAIAQTAARLGVDVICIASHGRGGLTRALVGSIADRLLRATRKPVLVLRPGS